MIDHASCLAAIKAKDARFDGQFFTAVTSTHIFCRPSCPAMTPKAANVRFYPTAAAAHLAGFRACKRCRPDATPGSPDWNQRGDVAARAMRLISEGVVDREGVGGLASRLGYSTRQLQRVLESELGAPALALARTQRAMTARVLIETTTLSMSDVSYAAGFGSIRQFNDTIAELYGRTPQQMRQQRPRATTNSVPLTLRLAYRTPLHVAGLLGHIAHTSVDGIEHFDGSTYSRTLRLEHASGVVHLLPQAAHVECRFELEDLRDLASAIARCRRLLDLDADPVAIDSALGRDLVLRRVIRRAPGRRIPGTVDPSEWAMRVVLGQQVSTSAARTHASRLVRSLGTELRHPTGTLTHLFPSPEVIAGASRELFKLPESRYRTIMALADALASGHVDLSVGAERSETLKRLLELPGIGPWSAGSIMMRALGDPDVLLEDDLGVRAAAKELSLGATPSQLRRRADQWRPWRSYAVQYLWSTSRHPINALEHTNQEEQ